MSKEYDKEIRRTNDDLDPLRRKTLKKMSREELVRWVFKIEREVEFWTESSDFWKSSFGEMCDRYQFDRERKLLDMGIDPADISRKESETEDKFQEWLKIKRWEESATGGGE